MRQKSGGRNLFSYLNLIVILGLFTLWLFEPHFTFAQVTPGAAPRLGPAILQPVSGQDTRVTSAPPPASGATLLGVFRAASSGPATVPITNFGQVDPANLGVFALQATALGQQGLNLTAVLDKAVTINAANWVRVPATYNSLRKTLNFSAVNGTIYGVFALQEGAQRTLPDSGGPATAAEISRQEPELSFLLVGFYLGGVLLLAALVGLALHKKKIKDKAANEEQG
jgi:hypothetical protein